MPSPNKTLPSPGSVNVYAMQQGPVRVKSREGWAIDGQLGHMAFKPGEDGRLERLEEVVKWLQASREIPRTDAIALVCDALPADAMSWLYQLSGKNKGFATLVPATYQFSYKTAEQIAKSKEEDRVAAMNKALREDRDGFGHSRSFNMAHGKITSSYREPTMPGLPSLLRHLQRSFGATSRNREANYDVLDDPKFCSAAWLAIPIDKAHELWGYGVVVEAVKAVEDGGPLTYSAMVEQRKLRLGSTWTDAQISALKIEDKKRCEQPGSGGRGSIAKDLALTVSRIHQLVTGERKSKRQSGPSKKPASGK